VAIDKVAWHKPVDVSEVKHALEIEKELGRKRALDGELILEESKALEPTSDLGRLSRANGHLRPKGKE
jgi:hypothetical protein